eukprot:3519763-Pyramimonas_sp.AAC.1
MKREEGVEGAGKEQRSGEEGGHGENRDSRDNITARTVEGEGQGAGATLTVSIDSKQPFNRVHRASPDFGCLPARAPGPPCGS